MGDYFHQGLREKPGKRFAGGRKTVSEQILDRSRKLMADIDEKLQKAKKTINSKVKSEYKNGHLSFLADGAKYISEYLRTRNGKEGKVFSSGNSSPAISQSRENNAQQYNTSLVAGIDTGSR